MKHAGQRKILHGGSHATSIRYQSCLHESSVIVSMNPVPHAIKPHHIQGCIPYTASRLLQHTMYISRHVFHLPDQITCSPNIMHAALHRCTGLPDGFCQFFKFFLVAHSCASTREGREKVGGKGVCDNHSIKRGTACNEAPAAPEC